MFKRAGPFKKNTWLSKGGKLILDGFRYERLGPESPKSWSERRDWLNLQPKSHRKGKGFRPQPFEQLAAVLREMGYTSDARDVALAKQWRMHMSGKLSWPAWVFRLLILVPSGYGYRPAWPALAGLLLILFAAGVFELAYRDGHMTPAQPHGALTRVAELLETHNDGETCRLVETTSSLPDFHAIAYAVDAFVPFVDLDQVASWKPSASARCVEGLDQINPPPALMGWTAARTPSVAPWAERGWLDLLKWLVTGFGVAITGLVALSLSGLLKRD